MRFPLIWHYSASTVLGSVYGSKAQSKWSTSVDLGADQVGYGAGLIKRERPIGNYTTPVGNPGDSLCLRNLVARDVVRNRQCLGDTIEPN